MLVVIEDYQRSQNNYKAGLLKPGEGVLALRLWSQFLTDKA